MSHRHHKGFTLIELLIAITILAVVAVMAYSGLNSVLKSHQILTQQEQSFSELSYAFRQLEQDLRQIVPRPVHNHYDSLLPALSLEQSGNVLFSFTRTGIPNPTGLKRSSLQRIDYLFANRILTKRIWLAVDNNNIADFRDEVMLDKLNQFKVEVLGYDNNWYLSWPLEKDKPDILPKAVKLSFNFEKTGLLVRLLELPQ